MVHLEVADLEKVKMEQERVWITIIWYRVRVIILGMISIIISWTAGFKRLAGATSSSWGNSSSSSQEEVKEKRSKQEVKTGEEDEKNVLEVTTAKLFKVLSIYICFIYNFKISSIAVHNNIVNEEEESYEWMIRVKDLVSFW